MSIAGKWGYEGADQFEGAFDTAEEAAAAFISDITPSIGDRFTVAQYSDPRPPWDYKIADVVIDHVKEQDDYQGDFASDWPCVGIDAEQELDAALRNVIREWVEKHKAMPQWGRADTLQECEATADGGFKFVDAA